MARETRFFHVKRMTTRKQQPDVRTLYFVTLGGSRKNPAKFFRPPEMPPFDGDEGYVEAERVKGGWKLIRQVSEADTHVTALDLLLGRRP